MRPQAERRTQAFAFARLARDVLEKHVLEVRGATALWAAGPNLARVRWRRADGAYIHLALRRHLDWVTGEAGISREAVELDALPLGAPEASAAAPAGYRIRLGDLLQEGDRWWPAGADRDELCERLEWLALQLKVRADGHFARHPLEAQSGG